VQAQAQVRVRIRMDDPRELLKTRINKQGVVFNIDTCDKMLNKYANESLIDAMLYVIADYIKTGRTSGEYGMSELEVRYYLTNDFYECADPQKWVEEHRESDDNGLIMFIFDNYGEMRRGKHKRMVLNIINMLYFDL